MTNICVFCGSSIGQREQYRSVSATLGRLMAENDCRLIYGGGKLGLMGTIAQSVLDHGGEVIGVIPDFMMPREVAHESLTELVVTESMHARKAEMARLADGFVVLPGGLGTLDETAEILTWNQLGIIQHPLIILNTENYFTPFLDLLRHMMKEGFLRSNASMHVVHKPEEVIPAIQNYKPSGGDIWDHLDRT